MSDHDAAPDPIDEAYLRAEAMLDDEAARAGRRARVLAAVEREPAAAAPAASRSRPWSVRRHGGWLAAASVAAICIVVAGQVIQPVPRPPRPSAIGEPTAPVSAPAADEGVTPPAPGQAAKAKPESSVEMHASPSSPKVAPSDLHPAPPPLLLSPPTPTAPSPPPPAPDLAAPPPLAVAPAPAPPSALRDVVVTARRVGSREADLAGIASSAGETAGQAASLRAAASAGRTSEVKALLAQGVPVDAQDADGDTALMSSIKADHPAAAAVLVQRGASLDRKNRAGISARDMARETDDPELDQALGLSPP